MSRRILFLLALCGLSIAASAQQDFNRFNFTAGGGLGFGRGAVANFTNRSYNGVVGGGVNFNRFFGVDAEYMYYKLAFRDSVIQQQGLPGAKGHLQSVSLNGIFNYKLQGRFGVYGIAGVGWYQRSVSARSQPLLTGTVCQPAWIWWDIQCTDGNTPVVSHDQTLSSLTKDAGGFNYGGGLTYRLKHPGVKVFAEFRYHRAYHSDVQTVVFPVTFGVRW